MVHFASESTGLCQSMPTDPSLDFNRLIQVSVPPSRPSAASSALSRASAVAWKINADRVA